MDVKESIRQFLPKYLSPKDEEKLISCINEFPANIHSRFYTSFLKAEPTIFQGDGVQSLPVVDLPNPEVKYVLVLILSNTCDVDEQNERLFPSKLNYSPIINLKKYIELLESHNIETKRLQNHIQAIKNQDITQIFYLPASSYVEESIVFLDRINSCSNNLIDRTNLQETRTFTLSNLGFYLLLLKMSISFTRIAEKVNRPIGE
jgi:hypothetical protein